MCSDLGILSMVGLMGPASRAYSFRQLGLLPNCAGWSTLTHRVGGGARASSAAMWLEGGARRKGPCPGVGWRSRREGLRGRVCFVCQLPKERERSGPVGQRAAGECTGRHRTNLIVALVRGCVV